VLEIVEEGHGESPTQRTEKRREEQPEIPHQDQEQRVKTTMDSTEGGEA